MGSQEVAVGTPQLPPVLKRFCIWVLALTCLSELYSWAMSRFFHVRPPYGGTFSWEGAGTDFTIFQQRFLYFRTPRFWDAFAYPFAYPAPLGVAYWLLYKLPYAVQAYLLLSICALLAWAWYFGQELADSGLSRAWSFAALVLFLAAAWPVRDLLQTGNLEMLVAVALGVGVLAALRGRWWFAAASIGLAGSMKLYPFLLFGLVLSQRRYKEFALGMAVAAAVTLASLATLGPSVLEAQRHVDQGLVFLKQRYILKPVPDGLAFSHSLFNLVKLGVVAVDHASHPAATTDALRAVRLSREARLMEHALDLYIPIVAALACAVYWLRIKHLPLLNQVIALTACAVLLPPFSLDYTLVQLLVPLGLLCVFTMDTWRNGVQPRGLVLCFASFALIFTTGAYFRLRIEFSAQVRTLALVALLFAALRYPFAVQGEPA